MCGLVHGREEQVVAQGHEGQARPTGVPKGQPRRQQVAAGRHLSDQMDTHKTGKASCTAVNGHRPIPEPATRGGEVSCTDGGTRDI